MNQPQVLILKGGDPYWMTKEALSRYPLLDLRGKRILIKPNAGRVAFPEQGITTHPSVVAAAIDYLKDQGAKEIMIGESCIFGVSTKEAFQKTGLREIAQRRKVSLLDLDRLDPMELVIPQGVLLKKIKVSSIINQVDFIVSIPVMKTHMHTRVSLSLKNMKGLLWRREKARLHHLPTSKEVTRRYKALDLAISEMATVLYPDLAIIDGTVGMEGMGPAYGSPKPMGMVIVSEDALSADAVASRLMGFSPDRIPHLKLAYLKGLGEIREGRMSIEPKDYLKWVKPFEPPPETFSFVFPDVVVHDRGSCSACLSTLLIFLKGHLHKLGGYRLVDQKIHIGIGKYLNSCPKGTILIGNCTSHLTHRGIFIGGCPPVSSQILKVLSS